MTTTERIGSFIIDSLLADGGMGVVYRARHVDTGELAALKTVRVPDATMLAAIRHELHALSRLDHPGVVRVLDAGVEPSVGPWFAMELVEGESLDDYARRHLWGGRGGHAARATDSLTTSLETLCSAPPADMIALDELAGVIADAAGTGPRTGPQPAWTATLAPTEVALLDGGLRKVLRVLAYLARTLAYLHGEGVVHRDLKPGNVLVDREGLPRVIDLGVAAAFAGGRGREAMQVTSAFVGTVDYTAPEQVRGEYVDARADLYALGCIVYELICGAPPFAGDGGPLQTLMRQLSMTPAPLSARCPEPVPAVLGELVAALLVKDPRRRPGHAADVAAVFDALRGEPEQVAPAWSMARPFLFRPALRGRDALIAAVEPPCEQPGRHVALVAASGAGRTRLAMVLGRRAAQQRDAVVISVRCAEAPEPLGVMSRLLIAMAEHGQTRKHRARVFSAQLLETLSTAMPALASHADGHRLTDPARTSSERAIRAAVVEAWTRFAQLGPSLIVLDDLDLADEASVALLAHLQRSGALARPGAGLSIISTRRADTVPSPALARLLAGQHVESHHLGALDAEAVAQIVGDMLALDAPTALVEAVYRCSEGNPFFISEMLHTAIEAGALAREAAHGWRVVDEPALHFEHIDPLIERRVAALEPLQRHVLQAAAVLGAVCAPSTLQRVADVSERLLSHATVELELRRLLEVLASGRLGFTNARVREVVLAGLDDVRRRRLHWRSAEALSAVEADRALDAGRIAEHWVAAGDDLRASDHFLRAARAAVSGHALEAAQRYYLAYLERAPATLEAARARFEYARDVLKTRGESATSIAELERVQQVAASHGALALEGEALRWIGVQARQAGDLDEARRALDEAVARLEAAGDLSLLSDVLNSRGNLASDDANPEAAIVDFERSLEAARQSGNRHTEAIVLGNLARMARRRGELARAVALHERALEIQTELGNDYGQSLAHANLAALCFLVGRTDEACAHFESSTSLASAIGDVRLEAAATTNQACLFRLLGRLDEAQARARHALACARRKGLPACDGHAQATLATVALERGLYPEAEAWLRGALALREHFTEPSHEPDQRRLLAEVLVRSGRSGEGRGQLAHALALAEGQPDEVARTLATEALLEAQEHEQERAVERARLARVELDCVAAPSARAEVLLLAAEALWRARRASEARELLGQAHAICTSLGIVLWRARAEVLLALCSASGTDAVEHERIARDADLTETSPLRTLLGMLQRMRAA